MYVPVTLFLQQGKRKEKFPHDVLLLSTFAFEAVAFRMTRINEPSLVQLKELGIKRHYDF
jgi:hypothetical protein